MDFWLALPHSGLDTADAPRRGMAQLSVALRAVARPAEHLAVGDVNRPAHHETPEKRPFRGVCPCVPPIGRTYGVTEDLPIMRGRADLLNYPPSTAKCQSSHGPRALPRMKTED